VLLLPEIAGLYGVMVDDLFKKQSVACENYAQRLSALYEVSKDPEDFLRCRLEYQKLMRSGELSMHDKWEYAEVRSTRWEVRSIKSGRLRLQVFSIDNKWRAARLAELSLRTSHLVLRTFVGTTNFNLQLLRIQLSIRSCRLKAFFS
jgi:hypothetical protein